MGLIPTNLHIHFCMFHLHLYRFLWRICPSVWQVCIWVCVHLVGQSPTPVPDPKKRVTMEEGEICSRCQWQLAIV